ncbi:MAG: beta-ketoacyl-ACP synthase III [Phycisphaerales bacterium]
MTASYAPPAGVRIAGTGMAVPPRKVSNDDLAKIVDTSDEWIRPRTGIVTRHLTDNGTLTSDLAAQAVTLALRNAKLEPKDLDLLVCATMTPDVICPATACRIVSKIGAVPCGAMDLNLACTGLVAALSIANNFIMSGAYKHVAVIGADRLSTIVNWEDRKTCVLFGDAAGAMVLSASDNADQRCLFQKLNSDGGMGDALYVPRSESDIPEGGHESFNGKYDTLQMNGREVYKFAVNALQECVHEALEHTGLTHEDIKMVIPHQSNIRMLQSAWKKMGFPDEKIYVNIDRFGNTSAASIGLCMHELTEQGRLSEGDHVIFVAQGGGLTWGASLWRL